MFYQMNTCYLFNLTTIKKLYILLHFDFNILLRFFIKFITSIFTHKIKFHYTTIIDTFQYLNYTKIRNSLEIPVLTSLVNYFCEQYEVY